MLDHLTEQFPEVAELIAQIEEKDCHQLWYPVQLLIDELLVEQPSFSFRKALWEEYLNDQAHLSALSSIWLLEYLMAMLQLASPDDDNAWSLFNEFTSFVSSKANPETEGSRLRHVAVAEDRQTHIGCLAFAALGALLRGDDLTAKEYKAAMCEAEEKYELDIPDLFRSIQHHCTILEAQINGDQKLFYEALLKYLAFASWDELDVDHAAYLAQNGILAALTAQGVYDFSALIEANVLSVVGEEGAWLVDLLVAVHEGRLELIPELLNTDPSIFEDTLDVVLEKVLMVALVNIAFDAVAGNRFVSFHDLQDQLIVPDLSDRMTISEVKRFIIKAVALELMQATLSDTLGGVTINFVRPRALTEGLVQQLITQFSDWQLRAGSVIETMREFLQTADSHIVS